jgi:hypothetical protein
VLGRESKGKNVNAWEGARGREWKGIAAAVVRVGNDVPIFSRKFILFSSRDISNCYEKTCFYILFLVGKDVLYEKQSRNSNYDTNKWH